MAHIQRKCSRCRRSVPSGSKACPACAARGSTWIARYRTPGGLERSKTFERKIDAARFLNDQEHRMVRGEWVDPTLGRVRFGEYAES